MKMLRLFARDGHQVHVVVPNDGPVVELLQADGISVHFLGAMALVERYPLRSIWGKLAFCYRYPFSVLWLARLIWRLKVDVVHTNSGVVPAPALAAWLTGRRHLWHIRELFDDFAGLWKYYQRYIYRFSTRIITISDAVRDQFEPRFRDKCVTIYNAVGHEATDVDVERRRRLRAELGNPELLVGVIGRIKWIRKGQEVLVRAAALLAEKHPELRYAIVGSVAPGNEDHLTRLHALVEESGLDGKVIFTGDVKKPRDMFAAFDITVVPSIFPEPFGRVVMESMAAGTPVIGSRCGGIPEQVVPGVTGLLFTPGDEKELAQAISQLLTDTAMRESMGREGQRLVREKFDDGRLYLQFADVFKG